MPIYSPPLLLLLMLAGWYLQGRLLRLLTDPNTDPAHLPRCVYVTNAVTLLMHFAVPAYLVVQAQHSPFLLGPLGAVLLTPFVADFFRFDRLFELKMKQYSSRLRALTVTGHGGLAFGIGVAFWDGGRLAGLFPTATLQILLAAAAGALTLVLEAIWLPRFVTVPYEAERLRLRRAVWKMAVVRANLFFISCALAYAGLFLTALPLSHSTLYSLAFAFIFASAIYTPFVTMPSDAHFMPDDTFDGERKVQHENTQEAVAAPTTPETADTLKVTAKTSDGVPLVQNHRR